MTASAWHYTAISSSKPYKRAEGTYIDDTVADLAALRKTQWSREFEQLMRNRLLMGAFRYGEMKDQEPNSYDKIGSAISRLKLYQETGNLEHLVDAANLCLVEFVTGDHPDKHFISTDDGEHTDVRR